MRVDKPVAAMETTGTTCQTTNAKFYVSVITLSRKDSIKVWKKNKVSI